MARGVTLTADRYALVPDDTDATCWRLPLYRDGADTPDPGLVRYAMGRLSLDAHPAIPVQQAREVRRRIRDAFAVCWPDREMPAALAKADTFDPSQLEELPMGVMVAFGLSAEAAGALALTDVPDGIDVEDVTEMHLTLAYMGPVTAWPSEDVDALSVVLRNFAAGACACSGSTTGGAILLNADPNAAEDACVALVDVLGLAEFRTCLVRQLVEFGMPPVATHDFIPHITLAYGAADALQALPLPAVVPLSFDTLVLAVGGEVTRIPLDGGRLYELMDRAYDSPGPIMRADDEQRYTMTPLYVPGLADSHGEGTDATTLQKAVWSYMDAGNRDVRLQHVPGTVAGRTVEIISWPYPVTCSMAVPGQDPQEITLPEGTVFQGVVWEPWSWALVKAGKLTGLSLGGTAYRVPTEGTA